MLAANNTGAAGGFAFLDGSCSNCPAEISPNARMEGNVATSTSGGHGGAIRHQGGSLTIGAHFSAVANTAQLKGGAIASTVSPMTLTGPSLMAGNKAQAGGALHLSSQVILDLGANLSVVSNEATSGSGGGIYIEDVLSFSVGCVCLDLLGSLACNTQRPFPLRIYHHTNTLYKY